MNHAQHDQPHLPYIHLWHYDMLVNKERSQYYSDLIKAHCRDKVVLEIGTGAGLLAALAIQHGAKQVICCEENPHLALVAMQLFQRLGVEDRIRLISKNSKDIKSDEIPQVDVVLHELFASDPFGEEMVPTLADARRFMKKDAIFLPEKIQLIYQPVPPAPILEKLSFGGVDLTEMEELLCLVHPGLRQRDHETYPPGGFTLPVVSIADILDKPYVFTDTNEALVGMDSIEVSFNLIHGDQVLQAAPFKPPVGERIHWFPIVFSRMDVSSNQLHFSVKNQIQLLVM